MNSFYFQQLFPGGIDTAGLVATFVTTLVTSCMFSAAPAILSYVANWLIYAKAGESGWKCLIPYYNRYTLYKIAWKPKMFWWELGLSVGGSAVICVGGIVWIFSLLSAYYNDALSGGAVALIVAFAVFILLFLALEVVLLVIHIKCIYHLSKCFGQGGGFTAGLVLLPLIFRCILAFGKYKYVKTDADAFSAI